MTRKQSEMHTKSDYNSTKLEGSKKFQRLMCGIITTFVLFFIGVCVMVTMIIPAKYEPKRYQEEVLAQLDDDTKSLWAAKENKRSQEKSVLQNGSVGHFSEKHSTVKAAANVDGETVKWINGKDFRLQLLVNHSVVVSFPNTLTYSTIIWFCEEEKRPSVFTSVPGLPLDYECFTFENTFNYRIDNLVEGTTYTFCLKIGLNTSVEISNCVPLHVPLFQVPWIFAEKKQLTIGLLCMVYLICAFLGALIAYFGVRTYPQLLQGSKNVIVVKKSNQTCYVSTISEQKYQENSFHKQELDSSIKKKSLMDSVSETPTLAAMPQSINISVKNLDRLCSLKSQSTYFEDSFSPFPYGDDKYETPKEYEKRLTYGYAGRSIPNNYGMSPRSPPPLPKRNSYPMQNTNNIKKED